MDKMDILYVIGRGSKCDNNEVRYSLRSIEKNGLNVGRVFMVGYLPDFINTNEVTFLDCGDMYNAKHKNILRCIEEACKTFDLSNEFLYSSDDHYYIRKTDFANYPYFCKGELKNNYAAEEGAPQYKFSLAETYDLLHKYGYTTHNFSWHGNTHFNKSVFLNKVLPLAHESYEDTMEGVEPTCLMLNVLLREQHFAITERHDCKLKGFTSYEDMIQSFGERECISNYDDALSGGLMRYLKNQFPNKSKYEK